MSPDAPHTADRTGHETATTDGFVPFDGSRLTAEELVTGSAAPPSAPTTQVNEPAKPTPP